MIFFIAPTYSQNIMNLSILIFAKTRIIYTYRALNSYGWVVVRIKGSHHQLKPPTRKGTVTIPHPKKDLPRKTFESILEQAGAEG